MQAAKRRSDLLREAFWRDEVPKAIVWLQREGHGPGVDAEALKRVLPAEPPLGAESLDGLVDAGLLRRASDGSYELTDAGRTHGARLFADDFEEFERPLQVGGCACGCCQDEPPRRERTAAGAPGTRGARA